MRCENAADSKTTDPVLISINDTDGLLSSGSADSRAKTLAAETESNADAVGAVNRLAANMAALNFTKAFI
jgi:hypothetical protein